MTEASAPEERRPPGRPSIKTSELLDAICHEVAMGENLDRLAKRPEFPSKDTLYRWLEKDPEFSDAYARARECRADARSDRIDDIIRDVRDSKLDPNAARVMVDAEKWQAAHENSRRYGDKRQLTGPNGGAIEVLDQVALAGLNDDEIEHLISIQTKLANAGGSTGGKGTP